MRAGVDSATSAAIAGKTTRPLYLVELGFNSVATVCNRGLTAWQSRAWVPVSMEVAGTGPAPTIALFNEGLGIGAAVLAQGTAGRKVRIWEAYGTSAVVPGAPAGFGAPVLVFSGEMSSAEIGDTITIQCKLGPPLLAPRRIMAPPIFNHLPRRGLRIQMPSQVYILE